jgi:hypothetical protein
MEMRNLRKRFGAFVLAGIMAGVLGSATTFADMGGYRNTCAFILGKIVAAPSDSVQASVFRTFFLAWDCTL